MSGILCNFVVEITDKIIIIVNVIAKIKVVSGIEILLFNIELSLLSPCLLSGI